MPAYGYTQDDLRRFKETGIDPHEAYRRSTPQGPEYSDGQGWFTENYVCRHCLEEQGIAGKPYRWGEVRYSFGCYAGRYCGECWPKSGYRDAVDPSAEFSPDDAGERIEPLD
jgi:hypothetical protein